MALKALSNDIEKKVTKIINKYYKTNGQNFIEYPEFLDEMVQKLIKSGPLLGVAYDANAEQSASLLQIFSNSEFDIKQSNPISNINNPYITTVIQTTIDGTDFVAFSARLHQVSLYSIEKINYND